MKNLREFSIHRFHNEPNLDDVYLSFVVFEYVSNHPFNHYISAANADDALAEVYEKIYDEYALDDDKEDGIQLSVELISLDEEDITWFKRLNHE